MSEKYENNPPIESTPKNVFVTGGTEGIGRSIIESFQTHDPDLNWIFTCSRGLERCVAIESFDRTNATPADLGDPEEVKRLIEIGRKRKINTLILNAAITGIPAIDEKEYTEEYIRQINEYAPLDIIRELMPVLRENNGLIIFISSALADSAPAEASLYSGTKHNVEVAIQELAQVKENKGVTLLVVRPGSVDTRIHQNILKNLDQNSDLYRRTAQLAEMGKIREPEGIGMALYQIADSRKLYNPETATYDQPIESGQIYTVTDEEYAHTVECLTQKVTESKNHPETGSR